MQKFHLPTVNAMVAFEAVSRHLRFSAAATELHKDVAAISRHVRNLEGTVRRPLLERQGKRMILTQDGERFSAAIVMGLSAIQRVITQLQMSALQNPDRLVVSVDPDFAGLWLIPRLADFYASVPDALVEVRAQNSSFAEPDPGASCTIQYTQAEHLPPEGDLLFRSHLFPVCAPSLARVAALRSMEDIFAHVLLHDRTTDEWDEYLQSCMPRTTKHRRSGTVFNETAHCLEAAARGMGIALGDDFLAATYLAEGRLVKPFDRELVSKNAYYLLIAHGPRRHPSLTAFRGWLLKSIDRHRNGTSPG